MTAGTLSSAQAAGEIAAIETYSKGIDRYIRTHKRSARIFADVSQDETARWREFRTERERDRADTGDNLNENAYVWLRDGKIAGANFTFQSPSRDWAQFVMYYFRQDGTLAKIDSRLNTFYGNMTVKRIRYYDADGHLLKSSVDYFDLQTQKRKRGVADGDFMDRPVPVYMKVSSLPFYNLVRH
ncbi:MAG TPA: hypothetical protein VK619_05840 [Pyrinomonadaceae bacterium]|nr:hypothetical protein [Pyrinomonadaceae bacterium]